MCSAGERGITPAYGSGQVSAVNHPASGDTSGRFQFDSEGSTIPYVFFIFLFNS